MESGERRGGRGEAVGGRKREERRGNPVLCNTDECLSPHDDPGSADVHLECDVP